MEIDSGTPGSASIPAQVIRTVMFGDFDVSYEPYGAGWACLGPKEDWATHHHDNLDRFKRLARACKVVP